MIKLHIMAIELEKIQPWDGQSGTGADARGVIDRNFEKIETELETTSENLVQLAGDNKITPYLERGTISNSTGGEVVDETRLRTFFLPTKNIESIIIGAPYLMSVYEYNADMIFIKRSHSGVAEAHKFDSAYIRFIIRKEDNSDISPGEAANLPLLIKLFSQFETTRIYPSFYTGTFYTSTGDDNLVLIEKNRAKTRHIKASRIKRITCEEGYIVSIYLYRDDKTFIRSIATVNSIDNIDVKGYFRLLLRRVDDMEFDFSDDLINITVDQRPVETMHDTYVGELSLSYMQGTLSGSTGNDYSPVPGNRIKTEYTQVCSIESITCEEGREINVFFYDAEKQFLDRTGWIEEYTKKRIVDGYIRILERYTTEVGISPHEGSIQLIAVAEKYPRKTDIIEKKEEEEYDVLFGKHQPPQFASLPYGEMINVSLSDKILFFENILDSYPAEVEKINIGKSYNDLYEVDAYIVTPEKYTVTISVDAHCHGNEKYNPVGMFAILAELAKPYLHPFMQWLRENVRWIIIPCVSPVGYVNHTRNINGVNPNRNTDYRWATQTDANKGAAPYSQRETKNVRDFFINYIDEIDFHISCHDIPATNTMAYSPATNRDLAWKNKIHDVSRWLAKINDVGNPRLPYDVEGGTISNMFNEVFGIPAMTPEHVPSYWDRMGIDLDTHVAKSAEQITAYLCMFANLYENFRGRAYYKRLQCRSFCSQEFGISTWTWNIYHDKMLEYDKFTQVYENDSIVSYVYTPVNPSPRKKILVIGGITDDDKNSALTIKRIVELLSKPVDKLAQHVANLLTCELVFIPVLNPNFLNENDLSATVFNLIGKYTPDYTLCIRGVKNNADISPITGSSRDINNFTTYSVNNLSGNLSVEELGIVEQSIIGRYVTINLGNIITDTYRYAYGVENWLEACINDIAAFSKEL